ncbi:50S ribosomal protein L6 [Gottschalkiaceae bacterium SANA]|nr:50S ribosomal protein L6 [Gottschalkiaceae bacterium SANA]
MSRVGLKPIELPAGVEITIDEKNVVTVKGPKGQLVEAMDVDMVISIEGNIITISRPTDNKRHRSLHGLTRALVANMIEGVSKGFEKRLEIVGVGYRAAKQGKNLNLSLGFSHPVVMEDPEGLETVVEGQNKIIVKGINKQQVGNYAAVIRDWRKPEPYKGKGIRYEGEYVRRKEGKTGK